MGGLRGFLGTRAGKTVAIALGAFGVITILLALSRGLGETEAAALSRERVFMCAATGRSFTYELELGDSIPVFSPHSQTHSGYPAELCYWTADGKIADRPTPVLLNTYAGKPGFTFCPDCGRLVVGQNPAPDPALPPPPTEAEVKKRQG